MASLQRRRWQTTLFMISNTAIFWIAYAFVLAYLIGNGTVEAFGSAPSSNNVAKINHGSPLKQLKIENKLIEDDASLTSAGAGLMPHLERNAKVVIRRKAGNRRQIITETFKLALLLSPLRVYAAEQLPEPLECQNGAIVSESAIPGAYQQVCMSLPKRSITLKTTGDKLVIFQGSGEETGGDDGSLSNGNSNNSSKGTLSGRTGVALWNSGILLTRLMDSLAQQEQGFFQGKHVLELGCGTALASIAASKLGAASVMATDGNEEVVQLAKQNLERNNVYPEMPSSSGAQQWGEASFLKWGSLDAVDFYDTADIVMGSDLTYNSGSWGLLSETFDVVLKPNGIVIYLTLGHSGFNVAGELAGFLTLIESQGVLEVIREDSSAWPFKSVTSLERLLNASLTSKERDVITGTGGFKIAVLRKKRRRR